MTRSRGLRARLTPAEVEALWVAWQQGQSETDIAQALARPLTSIHDLVARHGGIAPGPVGARRGTESGRARGDFAWARRPRVARPAGAAVRACAGRRSRREIPRHGTRATYRAEAADRGGVGVGAPPEARVASSTHRRLRQVVARRAPGAMVARSKSRRGCVIAYPDDPTMRVSHETIYRTLYVQARGALKRELVAPSSGASVRCGAVARLRRRGGAEVASSDTVSITERPPDRGRARHPRPLGRRSVGRSNELAHRDSRRAPVALCAFAQGAQHRLGQCGRGAHARGAARARRVDGLADVGSRDGNGAAPAVQRCDRRASVLLRSPQSVATRSNENTNGFLRQYFPRGIDLRSFTQRQLDAVARQLNTRPRATLGFKTPAAVLATMLHRPVETTASLASLGMTLMGESLDRPADDS